MVLMLVLLALLLAQVTATAGAAAAAAAAAPTTTTTCGSGEPGDQHGGKVVHGLAPHFINRSTAPLCCAFCLDPDPSGADSSGRPINAWVWQPSTTHCWCIVGSPGKVVPRPDRRAGSFTAPPSPPVPGPSAPPTVAVEPWGADSVRVRIFFGTAPHDDLPGALLPPPLIPSGYNRLQGTWGTPSAKEVHSGNIKAQLTADGVRVSRAAGDQAELWSTQSLAVFGAEGAPADSGYMRWVLSVGSSASEKIWGLGERAEPRLDNKGLKIDFQADQHNTKITIPWMVSSRRAGIFFNHPGWATLSLANETATEWDVTMALQLDFLITTHASSKEAVAKPYAAIQSNYYRAIGLVRSQSQLSHVELIGPF